MKLSNGKNGNGESRLFISNSRDICKKIEEYKKVKIQFDSNYINDLEQFVSIETNFRKDNSNRVEKWKTGISEIDGIIIMIETQNGSDDINRNYIGQTPHRRKENKTGEEITNIKNWDNLRKCLVPTVTTLQFFDNGTELIVCISYNKEVHKYNKPSGCSFISIEFFKKFSKANNIEIQHAMNGVEHKERKENGYFWPVDGYHNCEKHKCCGTQEKPCIWNNYVFEFQGTYWHRDKHQKDLAKKNFYINKGYNWFEISEKEWNCRKKILLKINTSKK
jgi:hypothetical protein